MHGCAWVPLVDRRDACVHTVRIISRGSLWDCGLQIAAGGIGLNLILFGDVRSCVGSGRRAMCKIRLFARLVRLDARGHCLDPPWFRYVNFLPAISAADVAWVLPSQLCKPAPHAVTGSWFPRMPCDAFPRCLTPSSPCQSPYQQCDVSSAAYQPAHLSNSCLGLPLANRRLPATRAI